MLSQIPPSILPGMCPHGLIAAVVDVEGEVVETIALEDLDLDTELTAIRHAVHIKEHGGAVAVYDGETGHLVIVLTVEGIYEPGAERFN